MTAIGVAEQNYQDAVNAAEEAFYNADSIYDQSVILTYNTALGTALVHYATAVADAEMDATISSSADWKSVVQGNATSLRIKEQTIADAESILQQKRIEIDSWRRQLKANAEHDLNVAKALAAKNLAKAKANATRVRTNDLAQADRDRQIALAQADKTLWQAEANATGRLGSGLEL